MILRRMIFDKTKTNQDLENYFQLKGYILTPAEKKNFFQLQIKLAMHLNPYILININ